MTHRRVFQDRPNIPVYMWEELHWLPCPQHLSHTVTSLVWCCLYSWAPSYLCVSSWNFVTRSWDFRKWRVEALVVVPVLWQFSDLLLVLSSDVCIFPSVSANKKNRKEDLKQLIKHKVSAMFLIHKINSNIIQSISDSNLRKLQQPLAYQMYKYTYRL